MATLDIMPVDQVVQIPQNANIPQPQMPQVGSEQMMAPLVNPAPQGLPVKRPPSSPEEFEQRKSEWTGILEGIKSNPELLQAMLTAGTRMMQGAKPGQNNLGVVGDALQAGAMHYGMLNANNAEAARKQEELNMRKEESSTRVAKDKQEMGFSAAEHPLKLGKAENDQKRSALLLKAEQLKSVVDEAQAANDPTGAKRAQAALDQVQAELDRTKAQTSASKASAANAYAGAAEHNVRTESERNKVWAQNILLSSSSTPEEQDQAREVLTGGKSVKNTSKDQIDLTTRLVKMEHPDWNEQQTAREVGTRLSSAKVNTGQLAMKVMENPSEYDTATVDAAKKVVSEYLQRGTGAGNPAAPGAETATDKAAWEKARNSVAVGQQYTGPDGLTYTRKK